MNWSNVMLEKAYYIFLEENSLEDTLFLRSVFEAGYKAGSKQ
jgi:hypothetical protein